MLKSLLVIAIVASVIFVIGANIYTSALDKQIAWEQDFLKQRADSVAYYRYEYKHSTSGTRRHVGKALQKVIDRLFINEHMLAYHQKELKELQKMRQDFAEMFW